MRVDLVVTVFDPASGEAVARKLALQAAALVARGHRVRIVCALAGEDAGVGLEGVELLELGEGLRPSRMGAFELAPASDALVEELARADVVHVHMGVPLARDLVQRLSERTRVCLELEDWHTVCAQGDRAPVGVRVSCPTGESLEACGQCLASKGSVAEQVQLVERLEQRRHWMAEEVRAAGRLLVPSRTHLVRLADMLPMEPARVRIVSPTQGLRQPGAAVVRKDWRGNGPLRLLCSGPRSSQSGLEDLVRGLAVLPEERVQLVLVGREMEPGYDERLRRGAGSLSIEVSQTESPLELRRQAARCHLAVLPSRVPGGYPLGVDEALAFGLPVLACHAEAAAERYGSDGLEQLPPRDPNAWTARVGQLLRRPKELSQLSAGMPAEVPGPEVTGERLESLYLNHAGPGRTQAS
ncbi:MAG: glycosyltransferase involved in cell wall biosynthesis [Planctomycetota bacterium]|jgi:glycosyltransferase involved in cell wall biosynthesis